MYPIGRTRVRGRRAAHRSALRLAKEKRFALSIAAVLVLALLPYLFTMIQPYLPTERLGEAAHRLSRRNADTFSRYVGPERRVRALELREDRGKMPVELFYSETQRFLAQLQWLLQPDDRSYRINRNMESMSLLNVQLQVQSAQRSSDMGEMETTLRCMRQVLDIFRLALRHMKEEWNAQRELYEIMNPQMHTPFREFALRWQHREDQVRTRLYGMQTSLERAERAFRQSKQ